MPAKVLVAMSGGVDSSVAAALLQEQGHELVGVTMNLYCGAKAADRGCCSLNAAEDAKKIAARFGFPHYTLNLKEDFKRQVIADFISEYRNGRTPNPCVRCNQFIKFDLLLQKARELDCAHIATGHYARVKSEIRDPKSERKPKSQLLKGKDGKKDQSYVLFRLDQAQLARTLFPLGEWTKDKVREKAKELGLPVAEKAESQELCFVADDDYGRFIREQAPELVRPGPIVDRAGKVVGEHQGIAFYTVGQRKGIGHHQGKPKYVIGLDPEKNAVIIGDDEDLLRSELTAEQVTFISGEAPAGPLDITAKIRYNSAEAEGSLYLEHGNRSSELRARVKFKEAQRAITPGQSVVFYQGDEVLGGGLIAS